MSTWLSTSFGVFETGSCIILVSNGEMREDQTGKWVFSF